MNPNVLKQLLVAAASDARTLAYAPYSQFRVGAAVALADTQLARGANVENASFGLSLCAERSAITQAVLLGAVPGSLLGIAVVADSPAVVGPCGACRQVLSEFAPPSTPVWLCNLRDGVTTETTLGALLPQAFGPLHLER